METGHYSIVDSDPLKEISGYHMVKHSAFWQIIAWLSSRDEFKHCSAYRSEI